MIKGGWQFVNSARSQGSSPGIDPWIQLDGRLAASGGTPQYPNLLNTYHPAGPPDGRYFWPSQAAFVASTGNYQQPQWHVPGVDYRVGITAGTVLKDPESVPNTTLSAALLAASPGAFYNTSNGVGQIECPDDNAIIDGFDFTLHSQNGLKATGNGITVSNCKLAVPSQNPGQPALQMGDSSIVRNNYTIKYNNIDGSNSTVGGSGAGGLITSNFGGTQTIQYNWLTNAWSESMNIGCGTTSGWNCIIKYNAIENSGVGGPPTSGAIHGDMIQFQIYPGPSPPKGTADSIIEEFNLWYESQNLSADATEGITYSPLDGNGVTQLVHSNSVFILAFGNSSSQYVTYDLTWNKNVSVTNSYVTNNFFVTWLENCTAGACGGSTGPYAGSSFSKLGNVFLTDGTTAT